MLCCKYYLFIMSLVPAHANTNMMSDTATEYNLLSLDDNAFNYTTILC